MSGDKINNIGGYPNSVTVQKGQTLSHIALENGISVADLLKANPGLTEETKLQIGQKLNLTNPAIEASRASIAKAIDYGYAEDYDFKIAENGDVILTLKTNKSLGEIRTDFQIPGGSLSQSNDIKGKYKPKHIYNIDTYHGYNDYDAAKAKKGDVIVVQRLDFNPNENRTAWDRFWANFF